MRGDRKWWGLLLCIPPCLSTIFCFIQQENIKTGWTHRVSLLYQHPPGFYSVKNSSLLWLEGLVCGPGLLLGKKPSPSCGNPDTKYRSNRFHWKHQNIYFLHTGSSSVANSTLSPSRTVLKKNFPPSRSKRIINDF